MSARIAMVAAAALALVACSSQGGAGSTDPYAGPAPTEPGGTIDAVTACADSCFAQYAAGADLLAKLDTCQDTTCLPDDAAPTGGTCGAVGPDAATQIRYDGAEVDGCISTACCSEATACANDASCRALSACVSACSN